tara:strand:+ start:938 stop:1465 length:528 start_codon:yes stop_codon:yes gene_type:complete
MEKIIIYVNGKDRIGIISDITKEISNLNGNIETSKMIKLEQDFNVLMLISINKERIEELTKKLHSYNDLDILVKKASNRNENEEDKYIFILKGADTEGIVHQCTQLFSKLKINITDLETQLMNAPITGSPLFYIKAIISIPKSESMEMIKDAINQLEVEANVKIKFDIYNPDFNH